MSQRTRRALERLGLHDGTHRSRQFGPAHATADLVAEGREPALAEAGKLMSSGEYERITGSRIDSDLTF